ncbi:Glycoside hydrolase [Mycena kentingensis (nom. inval.)]|nr:Glycoside hydrolase [Mycena kentingensis (nom. inval.)]
MALKVLVLGATGSTGTSVVNALLADPAAFSVEALVRPTSASAPKVEALRARGVGIRVAELTDPLERLVEALTGIDVVVSTIGPAGILDQIPLATAAKQAGVKRFVPCAYITVTPPGGVMMIRDQKQKVYEHIFRLHLPYTIVDIGYWYQLSFPCVPSGRYDYASFSPSWSTRIHAGGTARNMLVDARDIGRHIALIIQDERTLNRYVAAYGEVLTEEEVFRLAEDQAGEKIVRRYISADELTAAHKRFTTLGTTSPTDPTYILPRMLFDYIYTKYVREDNTPEYAKYLGYLDASELYPEFKPITFREFLDRSVQSQSRKNTPGNELQALSLGLPAQQPDFSSFNLDTELSPASVFLTTPINLPSNCAALASSIGGTTSSMSAVNITFEDCGTPFTICRCGDATMTLETL